MKTIHIQPEMNIKECTQLSLRIVAPIHIGNHEGELKALEFICDQGKTYIIDENKLGIFLRKHNLIDYFVNYVKGERLPSIKDFLQKKTREDIPKILPQITHRVLPGGDRSMSGLRSLIRDAYGHVFIPGASLKGALRTALLYQAIDQNPGDAHKLEGIILRSLQGKKLREYEKKQFSSKKLNLQERRLQNFNLPDARQNPHKDILRCLSVRDAYPVGDCKTQVINIKFLSKGQDGRHYFSQRKSGYGFSSGKDLQIWAEAIVAGTFVTTLVWDKQLYAQFRKENDIFIQRLDDCISSVATFNNNLINHEKAFYTSQYPIAQNVKKWYGGLGENMFRIGFGSGMLSTTIDILFSDKVRQEIRNVCGNPRGTDPAPKTRRIWQREDGQWLPMGWMAMKEKRDEEKS
ncbi:MAG: type III-A CRISPR-associated RAMP protein Csm5 [bacterium]